MSFDGKTIALQKDFTYTSAAGAVDGEFWHTKTTQIVNHDFVGGTIRERKSATFEAFVAIWERDYLSLSKPSTQSGTRSQLKRLKSSIREEGHAAD